MKKPGPRAAKAAMVASGLLGLGLFGIGWQELSTWLEVSYQPSDFGAWFAITAKWALIAAAGASLLVLAALLEQRLRRGEARFDG